ncbi:MAG: hypothetical protein M3442_07540, partial [Chloroflexota bacterium]|nr:hypothetical protein [Chloroflexota bacterium]
MTLHTNNGTNSSAGPRVPEEVPQGVPGHRRRVSIGRLSGHGEVMLTRSDAGLGLAVADAGKASASQEQPLRVELFDPGSG